MVLDSDWIRISLSLYINICILFEQRMQLQGIKTAILDVIVASMAFRTLSVVEFLKYTFNSSGVASGVSKG